LPWEAKESEIINKKEALMVLSPEWESY